MFGLEILHCSTALQNDDVPRMARLEYCWWLPSPKALALSWEPYSGTAAGRQIKWPNLGENTDKMSKSR